MGNLRLDELIDLIEQHGYMFELNNDGGDEPIYRMSVRRAGTFRGYPRAFYDETYDGAARQAVEWIKERGEGNG